MADDRETLIQANDAFYRALEELDMAAMEALWLPAPWVRCVHPGWDLVTGWPAVRRSFEQIFANTRWMRVTATAVQAQVLGEVGLVSCSENITAKSDEDVGVAVAQATNLFHRTPTGWRIFLHHASPSPVRVTQPFSGSVQ
jgi:hypothetical protein